MPQSYNLKWSLFIIIYYTSWINITLFILLYNYYEFTFRLWWLYSPGSWLNLSRTRPVQWVHWISNCCNWISRIHNCEWLVNGCTEKESTQKNLFVPESDITIASCSSSQFLHFKTTRTGMFFWNVEERLVKVIYYVFWNVVK